MIYINIKTLKRKLLCLFERIRLSEIDYKNIQLKAKMYDNMMSTINFDINTKTEDITDRDGNLIYRIPKSKTVNMDIDMMKMLKAGGVTFDLDAVKLNIVK